MDDRVSYKVGRLTRGRSTPIEIRSTLPPNLPGSKKFSHRRGHRSSIGQVGPRQQSDPGLDRGLRLRRSQGEADACRQHTAMTVKVAGQLLVLDPTGDFVLVGNQDGNSITVFRFNQTDRRDDPRRRTDAMSGRPVCSAASVSNDDRTGFIVGFTEIAPSSRSGRRFFWVAFTAASKMRLLRHRKCTYDYVRSGTLGLAGGCPSAIAGRKVAMSMFLHRMLRIALCATVIFAVDICQVQARGGGMSPMMAPRSNGMPGMSMPGMSMPGMSMPGMTMPGMTMPG